MEVKIGVRYKNKFEDEFATVLSKKEENGITILKMVTTKSNDIIDIPLHVFETQFEKL